MRTEITNKSGNRQTVVAYLLDRLYALNIKSIFAIPGAHVDGLLARIVEDGRFQLIIASHEEGAAYMADGYARMTEGPSAVIAINGPGASNLVTAAATSRIEKIPVILITGDVPISVCGMGGFQTSDPAVSDTQSLFRAMLSNTTHITEGVQLAQVFDDFEEHLKLEVFTPYHINLPFDIQSQMVDWDEQSATSRAAGHVYESLEASTLQIGSKIAMLVGEEVRLQKDKEAIAAYSIKYHIPVASTIASKHLQVLLPEQLRLGVFGYAGGPRAFEVILDDEIETLIVMGAALNERNTFAWNKNFFGNHRRIIHLSAKAEPHPILDDVIQLQVTSVGNALSIIQALYQASVEEGVEKRRDWCTKYQDLEIKPKLLSTNDHQDNGRMSMAIAVTTLNDALPNDTMLFLDSGDHRIFGGFFWDVGNRGGFQTAGLTAPMGWAIAAAIGASQAEDDRTICVLTGDGCMQMHGMELAAAARYNSKVIFAVSNNSTYGRIAARLKHQSDNLMETIAKLPTINWVDFAGSVGVQAVKAYDVTSLKEAIITALAAEGPYLIEMMTISGEDHAYPKSVFSALHYKG